LGGVVPVSSVRKLVASAHLVCTQRIYESLRVTNAGLRLLAYYLADTLGVSPFFRLLMKCDRLSGACVGVSEALATLC